MRNSYVAGILDGEGSITLCSNGAARARYVSVGAGMTDQEVIEALHSHCGGSIRTQSRGDRKDMHQWDVRYIKGLELLDAVQEYLVIDRRRKIAAMLTADPVLREVGKGRGRTKVEHNQKLYEEAVALNAVRREHPQRPSRRIKPTDDDCAYFAAILDGEGWISARHLTAQVDSTDPELLDWIYQRFGGKIHLAREAKGNCRRCWKINLRPAGEPWVQRVASEMLITRKRSELEAMTRKIARWTKPRAHYPVRGEAEYVKLREDGILRTVAARESGIPWARAQMLETS